MKFGSHCLPSILVVLWLALLGQPGSAKAATVYIGDAAKQGLAISPASGRDDSCAVTYGFVNTDGSGAVYTASATTVITITEVNFYKNATTEGTFRLTPFVAIFSGNSTNGSVKTGENYKVVAVGLPYTFTGESSAELRNLVFASENSTITLQPGETLIAGFVNSGRPGLVAFDDGATQNAIDYIAASNCLPGGEGGHLTGDNPAHLDLNRTQKFNIGFEIVAVPEPSMLLLSAMTTGGLLMRRRR